MSFLWYMRRDAQRHITICGTSEQHSKIYVLSLSQRVWQFLAADRISSDGVKSALVARLISFLFELNVTRERPTMAHRR